jgi:hypothetical protein
MPAQRINAVIILSKASFGGGNALQIGTRKIRVTLARGTQDFQPVIGFADMTWSPIQGQTAEQFRSKDTATGLLSRSA